MSLSGFKTSRINIKYIAAVAMAAFFMAVPTATRAQGASTDTIYSPKVNYAIPRTYEIGGITVSGADNFDDYVIIGFSGLTVGESIKIPGDEISTAIKRFWKQGLFSDVAITLTKTVGNKAWLNIALTQQPRVSEVRYIGVKKSDKDELESRVGIIRGGQINLNLIDKAEKIIRKYYDDKGYRNAEVKIVQHPDLSRKDNVIVDIIIDKKSKVKVHKIYISGNEVLSAKKVLILATGPKKARAVRHGVEGSYNHQWTISALQVHPNGILICDEPAAGELRVATYRYFKDIEKENLI